LSGNLDVAGTGEHVEPSETLPMLVQPQCPRAADIDRCAPHRAGVDEQLEALDPVEILVQLLQGEIAKLAYIGTGKHHDRHGARGTPYREIAVNAFVLNCVARVRGGHGTPPPVAYT
jgi:hypothetical protein